MNKFWWFITVMILPLNAASIFYHIEQETFNASFWCLVFIYTALSAVTGICLSNIEERKDN